MLLIPLIRLKDGLSLMRLRDQLETPKIVTNIPENIAVIFRGENFKTLHVSIVDNEPEGVKKSNESLKNVINSTDVPVQVSSVISSLNDVEYYMKIGCYRIVIHLKNFDSFALIKNILKEFSPNKIVVKINSFSGDIYDCNWNTVFPFGEIPIALKLKEIGVKRLQYSCFLDRTTKSGIDYGRIHKFADQVKLKMTLMGGVRNFFDLRNLTPLERYGIDSLIMGRALYENCFCCENLWRKNEELLDNLGPTRRI